MDPLETHRIFIFFDTETTGLDTKTNEIIEIALLTSSAERCFDTLVRPESMNELPRKITELTGITYEMCVRDGVSKQTMVERVIAFIDREKALRPNRQIVLCGHNARNFDVPILKRTFEECGREFPSDWRTCDTMLWSMKFFGFHIKHGLAACVERYALNGENGDEDTLGPAHRALSDTYATLKLFRKLMTLAPTQHDVTQASTVEFLDAWIENEEHVYHTERQRYFANRPARPPNP